MYKALEAINNLRLDFAEGSLLIMNIAIAIIMFGVALDIKPSHFKDLLHKPKAIIIGFLSQFLILPLITFLLVLAFWNNITAGVAMGMILVAACPGGNVSNFLSSFSRSNSALSVSLTAIATMAAVILTPFNFAVYGKAYQMIGPHSSSELLQQLSINPFEMFKTVVILLGIPIVIGMLFNKYFPKITLKVKKVVSIFSIIFFLGIVAILFSKNYDYFIKYIFWILLIVFIHNFLALLSGYYFAHIFKLSKRNKRTISLETGIQNSGLGLILLFNPNIFPQDLALGGMMFITAWWGIWHIISGLSIATYWRFKPTKD